MPHDELSRATEKPAEALERMIAALRILDELEAPGDIGSHLDLAIARLRQRFGIPAGAGPSAPSCSNPVELEPAGLESPFADAPDGGHFPPL